MPLMGALLSLPQKFSKGRLDRDPQPTWVVTFGEFNFGDLAEEDLLRSIRLFGTEVIPHLRDFEPF
jgi:hypothetical protein